MNHLDYCDALELEISRFADVLATATFDDPVPGCPDWSVGDLALHLGTIHRWAERLVADVATTRQSSSAMGLVLEPVGAPWIRDGGEQLVETLRRSDPAAPMWTWGADQHLGWWARRQLHETLVHRADLEAACGLTSDVPADFAADAIDEFLVNLECAGTFSPLVREIRGSGEVLNILATDGKNAWSVELTPDGFTVGAQGESGDAELSGPALDLLLVLYRRLALSDSSVLSSGSGALVDFWLAHCALE
jgi:uncharacterized protein (TIGR03083 family)